MKRNLIAAVLAALAFCVLLTALSVSAEAADVAINSTNFPDANFRSYVSSTCDTNDDGVLSASEIAEVKSIAVYGKSISSVKGVEYLTALTRLTTP